MNALTPYKGGAGALAPYRGTEIQADLTPNLRGPLRMGIIAALVLIVGLGGWGATAMLASAAHAPGVVKPEGYRRAVQHLEGGIVKEIMVRDGDRVQRGQPLVELDDVRSVSDYKTRFGTRLALEALEASLVAEINGADSVSFPAEVEQVAAKDAEIRAIITDQSGHFDARRAAFEDRIAVLEQQKLQAQSEIDGLEAVITAAETRLSLNKEETESIEGLYKKGLAVKSRVLELQGAGAELTGRIERTRAEIARAERQIGELDIRILEQRSARRDQSMQDLAEVRNRLLEARNSERASEDVLSRTVISAPVDGIVMGLTQHTVGGVVSPGSVILELIPDEEELVVEARVSPLDIDTVYVGQPARITFTAFKQQDAEPVEGEVQLVSADRIVDERTGEAYYSVRVVASQELVESVNPEMTLTPGMPADVMIQRGERTALAYLLEPFTDALERAFTED